MLFTGYTKINCCVLALMKLKPDNLLEKTVHFKAGGLKVYCFIRIKKTALCIFCNENIVVLREYNIRNKQCITAE
jgi:hypothetical protein